MKGKISKIVALIMGAMIAVSAFGCGKSGGNGASSGTKPTNITTGTEIDENNSVVIEENKVADENNTKITKIVADTDEHFVTGTLHNISVEETAKNLVVNGKSEYKIVLPKNPATNTLKAAGMIQQYILESAGAKLEIVYDDAVEYSADSKYIVVWSDKLFAAAGISNPQEDIGPTGYFIRTKDDSVFIGAKNVLGICNGARKFLKYTVGFEAFSKNSFALDYEHNVKFKQIDITERPDFDLI